MKNSDGETISYTYNGIIAINEAFGLVMIGHPKAETVDFGQVFTHVTFQTGSEKLKGLETSRFVGTSRFILEEGKDQVIEMKISKIVKG